MLNYFKRTNRFRRSDNKPFLTNWEFTTDRDYAMQWVKAQKWYVLRHFIVKYILSIRYGCGSFSVPWGVQLSGSIFNHNTLRDGAHVDTDFLQTIQILERDKKGTLYCATTVNGDSYYFRSEDSSESFDEIVGKSISSLDLIMRTDPSLYVVPLVVISEED